MVRVDAAVLLLCVLGGGGSLSYMTAHWVAPQQSLMMATPDLVMDGLLGGGSGTCLFDFGGSSHAEKQTR